MATLTTAIMLRSVCLAAGSTIPPVSDEISARTHFLQESCKARGGRPHLPSPAPLIQSGTFFLSSRTGLVQTCHHVSTEQQLQQVPMSFGHLPLQIIQKEL